METEKYKIYGYLSLICVGILYFSGYELVTTYRYMIGLLIY